VSASANNLISVVLPTYNRLDQLKQVVAGLERQNFPRHQYEVIVVSDGAVDGTNEYLKGLKTTLQLRPILQRNQGVAAARNHGVYRAKGQLILFVDDDVVPEPELIGQHWQSHQEHGDDVIVLGPMNSPPDFPMSPWVLWEQRMLLKQYESMVQGRWQPTARQFYTGNTSLARHHIVAVGGFDPAFRRAEDVELAYRLADRGLRFVFNPAAVGHHYARRSFNSWLEIPYAYGRNDVIFTQRKGQHWLLPTIMYEFHGRHSLIKLVARLCLDRPRLSAATVQALNSVAHIGHHLRLPFLPRFAYSGIFNLRHYQGIADEIGGRDAFFQGVNQTTRLPAAPYHENRSQQKQSEKNNPPSTPANNGAALESNRESQNVRTI
jgi:GT2 family glycosyltransferase